MGQPAARLTDMHTCPMVTGIVPHVGGPIIAPGCPTVLIGALPAARVTDQCVCVGPTDVIVVGAFTTLIGGLPAARLGDATAHGGVIVVGDPTVLIGNGAGDDDDDDSDPDSDEADADADDGDEASEDSLPDQSEDQPPTDTPATQTPDSAQPVEELHAQAELGDWNNPDYMASAPSVEAADQTGLSAGEMGALPTNEAAPDGAFQLGATQNEDMSSSAMDGSVAGGGQWSSGDVYGQVISGGTGSAPSNPFPLSASENTSNPADPTSSSFNDPWSRWTTGAVQGQVVGGGASPPPLQGGASTNLSRPPLQGAVSRTGGIGGPVPSPPPAAPSVPLIRETPIMDTSNVAPGQSKNFDLQATDNQFNLGAQKSGQSSPPSGPGGGSGKPVPDGGGPPATAPTKSRTLQGGVVAVRAVVTLPDHTRVDSGPPQSQEEYNFRAISGGLAGYSSGSSDEGKETRKAFGLSAYTDVDPNQKQREENEKTDYKSKEQEEKEKMEELKNPIEKRSEITTRLSPFKAKAVAELPEK